MTASVLIAAEPFDPDTAAAAFRRRYDEAGAIVTFTGFVRGEGGRVSSLNLTHYPGFTDREISRIVESAMARWPLAGVTIIHRVGELLPREAIVFVAAAASHRRDAFLAIDYLMDYLKSEAPFWKHERRWAAGQWIEPGPDDHKDKKRWRA